MAFEFLLKDGKKERGVSLAELLLVMTILMILASFAFQSYTSSVRDAQMAKANNDLAVIKQAIKMYNVQTAGQYPPTIEALVGKYLPTLPVDPWGVPYKMDTASHKIYCIIKGTTQEIKRTY